MIKTEDKPISSFSRFKGKVEIGILIWIKIKIGILMWIWIKIKIKIKIRTMLILLLISIKNRNRVVKLIKWSVEKRLVRVDLGTILLIWSKDKGVGIWVRSRPFMTNGRNSLIYLNSW